MILVTAALFAAGLLLWPLAIFRTIAHWRWASSVHQAALDDVNRNRFGELRTRLMALARDERVSIQSPAFRLLYRSLTTLMRNPHAYREASETLLTLPDRPAGASRRTYSAEEASILVDLADRLDLMCRDYSRMYRILAAMHDVSRNNREHLPERLRKYYNAPLWVFVRQITPRKWFELLREKKDEEAVEKFGDVPGARARLYRVGRPILAQAA